MADPFDRAWDFMKNEDEDPKQSNTTGNIDPNRSSRILDMFSGLGGPPSHPPTKEFNIQIPRKFSDLTPSHERPPMEEDYDSKLMDILEQIRQGGKPSDRIHGSPPFNPSQQREPQGEHSTKKPKLGQGLLDRAKANNVTNPGSSRYQGKPKEGKASEDKPEKPDGDKDE